MKQTAEPYHAADTLASRDLVEKMSSFQGSPVGVGIERKQEDSRSPCMILGNPVFSCTMNPSTSTSRVFQARPESILFRTTSSEYGAIRPSYEMAPCYHYPVSQQFSEHLGTCGMYRNHSFNTVVDKSRVHDCVNLHSTI
ncbi:piercer of microtubule wall 2 protein isoform X2 [Hyla sarda]|uniref:piercer of microtubule wall 2 protein isoform X2 n=1 Tax=Hyla sarda TaxID=327740 RepID=UPI0024C23CC4|nr:piercer of microtubule wall 2 protein isoform X2 [Hyla sarda]